MTSSEYKPAPILIMRGVSKTVEFDGDLIQILSDIDIDVAQGESLAICGVSGSGKTTLLGLLGGMDLPSEGEIVIDGVNMVDLDEEDRAKMRAEHIGFVFQSFQLIGSLTALENVLLPMELKQQSNALELAREYLERVGLSHRLAHYPANLSGGEQQRVAIARAFACHPTILFADEPTGNLDTKTGAVVSDLLFELNKESGTTLVLVTHDERLAERCDRTIHLVAGEIQSC